MPPRKWTLEKVVEKIKEIHGDIVTIDPDTFINTNKRARFIDSELWNEDKLKLLGII